MEKTDNELIAETLSGSMVSFDHLMERYQKLVYKSAYGFGKNPQNALDITQNVFLKVFEKLSTFRGKSSFKTWLMRIAFYEGINWSKKNQNFQSSELDEASMMSSYVDLSQEDEVIARENRAILLQSLFSLNTRYRLAVVLRYYNNMPLKDIAEILDCSEGLVKNMLFRSLQQLKMRINKMNRRGFDGKL